MGQYGNPLQKIQPTLARSRKKYSNLLLTFLNDCLFLLFSFCIIYLYLLSMYSCISGENDEKHTIIIIIPSCC